jgi:hypothetical protein
MVSTTTAEGQNLLQVVPEEEPHLFRKGHFNLEVGQEWGQDPARRVVGMMMHGLFLFGLFRSAVICF